MSLTKTCRKCSKELPATLEFFYKNSGGKYGLTPRCKSCVNEDNKESHAKRLASDPERIRALANARSKKHYHGDLEKGRKVARDSARKARQDPKKRARINARKRAGGAGMTPDEIQNLLHQQGGCCAICGSTDPQHDKGWNIDHCHTTGAVRFILCGPCNRGLAAFRDNPESMRKAADLLEAFYQAQAVE